MPSHVFPFAQYWWLYAAFTAGVALLLAVDLTLHRRSRAVSFREALGWTVGWVALALAFGAGLYLFTAAREGPDVARRIGLEFLAGYVVEESLSVDNMFVFALIFRYFAVPAQYQHRILFYGVLGAMVFRALFIAAGSALVQFHWVMVLFGGFLVVTGVRMAFHGDGDVHPGDSPVVRLVRRVLPVTRELHGPRFFATVDGVRHATPLLVVLAVLETTDVVFAVDSVPAVFGVTSEPLVVYTSNVLAVMGLRSLYFVLAGAMDRFWALKYGLSAVLVFVGVKMAWLDAQFDGRFPIAVSLAVIVGVLATATVVSLTVHPRPAAERASPPPRPLARMPRWAPDALGVVLLGLGVATAFLGVDPGRRVLPPGVLERVAAEGFLFSASCWAVLGALLLRVRR